MALDTQTQIETAIAGPRRAKTDGVEVEQHPLPDQIAAAKYLDGKAATAKRASLGVKLVKLSPLGGD